MVSIRLPRTRQQMKANGRRQAGGGRAKRNASKFPEDWGFIFRPQRCWKYWRKSRRQWKPIDYSAFGDSGNGIQ